MNSEEVDFWERIVDAKNLLMLVSDFQGFELDHTSEK